MDTGEFRKRGKEMVDFIADYLENLKYFKILFSYLNSLEQLVYGGTVAQKSKAIEREKNQVHLTWQGFNKHPILRDSLHENFFTDLV